jgi:nicotinate phosphoribosyltransferase
MPNNTSLALLTDLYQLTMAYAYWKSNTHKKEAVFHLYFRENPFKGGFTIACGLQTAIDYLERFIFDKDDLRYLGTLKGTEDQPLFDEDFLKYLAGMKFECAVSALEEGTVVFPNEPVLRIQGPIYQCQLLETALLNIINFQSLIATKAARVCHAAKGDPVLEFGLRRAQGYDGAVVASRAAYIGGCAGTSNVLAGKMYGIPVKGTHAHSWIMAFDSELEAFEEYAKAMPHNCHLLVDTYDTLDGVRNAIIVGKKLQQQGKKLLGIRIDSGDLAYLSQQARKLLDDAGLKDTKIVASNDLDEIIIESLKDQDAKIAIWGVGTRLTTSYDQPALGGIYKLSAIRSPNGQWEDKIKLSENQSKTSHPGILQVRRFFKDNVNIADAIYDERLKDKSSMTIVDPGDMTRKKAIPKDLDHEDLLKPIFEQGRCVYQSPSIDQIRAHAIESLSRFHESLKRFINPHSYPVGFEQTLFEHKMKLIIQARENHERSHHR